jgi:hypothetical protein
MKLPLDKLLAASTAALATILAGVTVTQAVSQPKTQAFRTLDVQRVNLREQDGTLRMVMAGKSSFPGIIWRNKDYPHPSRNNAAGWIFLNDEGTENGGMIWGAKKEPDGRVHGFGHLSFDQYENDQVVSLEQSEDSGHRRAGLTIMDRPDQSMDIPALTRTMAMKDGPEKQKALQDLASHGFGGQSRLFFGKQEGTAELSLKDGASKPRLRARVAPDGDAAIEFLDADGKVVRALTPKAG